VTNLWLLNGVIEDWHTKRSLDKGCYITCSGLDFDGLSLVGTKTQGFKGKLEADK